MDDDLTPNTASLESRIAAAEAEGRDAEALTLLRRLEEAALDRGTRLEIRARIARVLDRMGDPEAAIDAFRNASIGRQTLIHNLKELTDAAAADAQRGRYYYEIGTIYQELGNTVSAHSYFETALGHDPTLLKAAEPLADAHLAAGRLERARRALMAVVEAQRERPDLPETERHRRLLQLGRVDRELGDAEGACDALQRAHELHPDDPDTIWELANALFEAEQAERSLHLFEGLLADKIEALDHDQLVQSWLRAGLLTRELGDPGGAAERLERAVRLAPGHLEARARLVECLEEIEDWERLIDHTTYLMQQERDLSRRFGHLVRIGELWSTKLGRPDLARQAWEAALDLQPNSITVLHDMLEGWQRVGLWPQAIETLERMVELEADPIKRARLHYTIGILHRDQLDQPVAAVRAFDEALDIDPGLWKAFDAIVEILGEAEEWRELERTYRRMMRRVYERGATLQRADQIAPVERRLREGLLEVYAAAGPEFDEHLIAEHLALLDFDPWRADSYHALFDAYLRTGATGRAHTIAGILIHIGEANQAERELHARQLGAALQLPSRPLGHEERRLLYHPDEDPALNALVEALSQSLRPFYARLIREWGLHPRRHLIPDGSSLPAARIFRAVAHALDFTTPPLLFARDDEPGELRNLNNDPPAFLAGADFLAEGRPERELASIAAYQLAWARPEHYLGAVFPAEMVHGMVMAALHVAEPTHGIDRALGKRARPLIREIQALPPTDWIRLNQLCRPFFDRGAPPDIPGWLRAVELTALRTALLFGADLPRIARLAPDDRARQQLLRFAMSDAHHELRHRLDLEKFPLAKARSTH